MNLKMNAYRNDDDYWRLRTFLRDVFILNNRQETSWQTARLDYWRYYGNPHSEHYALSHTMLYWETDDGQIAGMLCPETRGHAHLHLHPAFRTPELEGEMIQMAETQLAETDSYTHQRGLTIWAHQDDELRGKLLEARGYQCGERPEYQFCRTLDRPLQNGKAPAGYTIRALNNDELPARALIAWRVAHPSALDSNFQGWRWYRDIQRCPLYRRDLDLVAIAPNGQMAGFMTLWYDDVTRTGYFEPVGICMHHRRHGLASALMMEGLRRLKAMGGISATVRGCSDAEIQLYTSVMQTEPRLYERWCRALE